jgi:hypothetical protein
VVKLSDEQLAEMVQGGTLTEDERYWHQQWRGQVAVVYSVEDALRVIGAA